MKINNRVTPAFICLICFLVLLLVTLNRVDAESLNNTNDFSTDSIKEVNSSDQDISEVNDANDAQENDEKDGVDAEQQRIDFLSVLLGGILGIAGSVITAIFSLLEASKQRDFQKSMAKEERKEEQLKEKKIIKQQAYIGFIKCIRDLNNSIRNEELTKECLNKHYSIINENYAHISLISSQEITKEIEEVINMIHFGMKLIPTEKISALVTEVVSLFWTQRG